MRTWTRFRTIRLMKLAAGVLIAAALVAAGWTAEKLYRSVAKKSYYLELERFDEPPVTLPDGSTMGWGGSIGTMIPADAPPGSAEKAKKHHEEMKQLIAQKKYELVKTHEMPPGEKQYVYRFSLADGTPHVLNFSIPLENVVSWDDYLQKTKEHRKQWGAKIYKAFAAGKFRLLAVEPMLIHVCREVDSSQKILVQRITLLDGKQIASVRRENANSPEYQTSWQDHLEAVRQGKRVLLEEQQTAKILTYEVTLEDGSTTQYQIGSVDPPEKLESRLRQLAGAAAAEKR